MIIRQQLTVFTACLSVLVLAQLGSAREIHVAKSGADANSGAAQSPYLTIGKAAAVAQPGDTITVHAGVYRERVTPPRGGSSDSMRIVYQAAPGARVLIKGSEIIKGWQNVQGDTWKVVLPNSFFGKFNPYRDLIHGDWFNPRGRQHHTGAVYVDGHWLTEAASLDAVRKPVGDQALWFGQVDANQTTIWAQFKGVDPNTNGIEINVRQTVFYPAKPGVNYLTVRGFTMEHAATPWAPPTAEQMGLIGTHWSKGWIIENNTIRYSICVGVALGKYGDKWDNTSQNTAVGYVKTIERALANGWNKETIGHHIVRKNRISNCEQAGVVGSMGCVFSQITDNDIFDIWAKRLFSGAEMAGIKFHGAVDTLIARNRIHNAGRGMWMDWMAQGTRISGNLCYNNTTDDLFAEVDHGPFLVDNNILLSPTAIRSMSEGGAFVHNLVGGDVSIRPETHRDTPYLVAHSTQVAGLSKTLGGDDRFYNNVFVRGHGLKVYDKAHYPCFIDGNVYLGGTSASKFDTHPVVKPKIDPDFQLLATDDSVSLTFTWDARWNGGPRKLVTTRLLGKTAVGRLPFVNTDDSALCVDTDYFGKPRDRANPTGGPFQGLHAGTIKLEVWPRKD